jgi:hypothetical protein
VEVSIVAPDRSPPDERFRGSILWASKPATSQLRIEVAGPADRRNSPALPAGRPARPIRTMARCGIVAVTWLACRLGNLRPSFWSQNHRCGFLMVIAILQIGSATGQDFSGDFDHLIVFIARPD